MQPAFVQHFGQIARAANLAKLCAMAHKVAMFDLTTLPQLPISGVLSDIVSRLESAGQLVLQAPPGAGKTTMVPLALLAQGHGRGRILMLEPRRLAARTSAARMAELLGEPVGERVGFRVRGQSKTSDRTRIEVVTEGILTRMIQSDAELPGVDVVIFDEFHERSLNADLGLALACDIRATLRPDLKILVMSATLDAQPIADMLGAPILTSDGQNFPVETIWDSPKAARDRSLPRDCAQLIARAYAETDGGVLVFLPGAGEIAQVQRLLGPTNLPGATILPLYGALPFKEQAAALAPIAHGRKIVLATSIAETSLTIPDTRVVIDTGLAREAAFDPASGMSRLVTRPVSKAEADQRRGRAGRVAAGWCYRMWARAAEGALPAYPLPEIVRGDLTGLALDLALWGSAPDDMAFLTPPDAAGLAAARALLTRLGAIDQGRITAHGRAMAALPLHPRLAHMLVKAGKHAAKAAAILNNLHQLPRDEIDLARLTTRPSGELRAEATRLARLCPENAGAHDISVPQAIALAYPDRIGKRRPGEGVARFHLSGGKGAELPRENDLSNADFLVIPDMDARDKNARIRRAIQISEAEIRELFTADIAWRADCNWSSRERKIIAREAEVLGQLQLKVRAWPEAPQEALMAAALQGIREVGLPFSRNARLFQARAKIASAVIGGPDFSDPALLNRLEDWLAPYLTDVPRTANAIAALDILPVLRAMFDFGQMAEVDRIAPAYFVAPTGRKCPIDYSQDAPEISIRLQEMFGLTTHPMIGAMPLVITLLSPAGRPLQTTADLPGFWATSYGDVRKDMRGRYPKHHWPEDPAAAAPTQRAKPKGR